MSRSGACRPARAGPAWAEPSHDQKPQTRWTPPLSRKRTATTQKPGPGDLHPKRGPAPSAGRPILQTDDEPRQMRAHRSESPHRRSGRVARNRHCPDLGHKVLPSKEPRRIVVSSRRSPVKGRARRSKPCRSPIATLKFQLNRASSDRSQDRKATLLRAKAELGKVFRRAGA